MTFRSLRGLLRTLFVVSALVLASGCLTVEQASGLAVMNWDRGLNGRQVLPPHDALVAKTQAWAEKMARDNQLSHSNLPAGVPSCWRGLGENVGYGASIVKIEEAYMRSSAHRGNILNTAWDYAAVGVAHNGNRVFTVQVFMDGC